jgi:peptide-methionine (S)-S-oxide reductase
MTPRRLEIAVFGTGSFLRTEAQFGIVRGIWKTAVGYAGVKSAGLPDRSGQNSIETVRVEYDPIAISYGQLLEMFLVWEADVAARAEAASSPPENSLCIFIRNEFEKRMAQAAVERYRLRDEKLPHVHIAAYKTFHMAPNLCQKHFLRTLHWLMKDLQSFYSDEAGFVHSTLTMRLNGIVGQVLPFTRFPEDVEFYDLQDDTVCHLKEYLVS